MADSLKEASLPPGWAELGIMSQMQEAAWAPGHSGEHGGRLVPVQPAKSLMLSGSDCDKGPGLLTCTDSEHPNHCPLGVHLVQSNWKERNKTERPRKHFSYLVFAIILLNRMHKWLTKEHFGHNQRLIPRQTAFGEENITTTSVLRSTYLLENSVVWGLKTSERKKLEPHNSCPANCLEICFTLRNY